MTAQSDWTRIGVAFGSGFEQHGRNGSLSVQLDFIPSDPDVSIHIREPRPQEQQDQDPQTGETANC